MDNVIASKKGVVVYPYEDWQTQFADHPGSAYGNNDGGGYGNYVKIDHGNGEYTLYAHMAQNSIIVRAGDIVEQGQVIGKVGHTGSSTGAHLHFEIYIGGSTHDYRVDPLLYVNPDNPRPNTKGIKEWIKTIEDGTSHHMNGDNYIVYKANDGSLKVGYGITLVDKDGNRLYKDIYNGPINEGAIIANEIVDEMFETMIAHSKALLNSYITANNTTLLTHQYDAILSVMLDEGDNVGNILLQTYGNNQNTTALWQKMSQYITRDDGGKLAEIYSLKLRRAEEFELFMEGDYEYDPLGYTSSSPVKYYDVDNW